MGYKKYQKIFPELADVQRIELEMLIKFDEICQKHDLSYFLDSGTVLGAIRHGGFIPWDDDIDVGMPRNDYNRFMNIGQKELGEDYFLQNRLTDPKCPLSFAKIRKRGTTFIQWDKRNVNMHQGIYIDIFPYDTLPAEEEDREEYMKRCIKLNSILIKRMVPDRVMPPQKSLKWFAGAVVRRFQHYFYKLFLPVASLDMKIDKEFARYSELGSNTGYSGCHAFFEKIVFPNEILFPTAKANFAGHVFSVPADCDKYLTLIYGDYMKLPPENERLGHRPIIVSTTEEICKR